MHGVGFEPTNANIADLKSAPLDHSGNHAKKYTLPVFFHRQISQSSHHQITTSYIF